MATEPEKKLTSMTRDNFKAIAARIDAALQPIAEELGISISRGRGTYDEINGLGTLKVEVAIKKPDGTVATREAAYFREAAPLYGLKPEDLGRTFEVKGEQYQLVGLKPRAEKMPFLVKRL